jgi:hypothetical protein
MVAEAVQKNAIKAKVKSSQFTFAVSWEKILSQNGKTN